MLTTIADQILNDGVRLSATFAILLAIEVLWPRDHPSPAAILRAAVFWLISAPVASVLLSAFHLGLSAVGYVPLFEGSLGGWFTQQTPLLQAAGMIIAPIIGAVLADFFFYWGHRAQHRFLWRWHAVHHSIRHMSGISSYHHVSEGLVRLVLVLAPPALLFAPDQGATAPLVAAFLAIHGFYIHSSTRLHLRPLRWVIGDNQFHRIHHSTNPAHHGRNFGSFSTVWDRIFGTAYFPRPDEWPETGLADVPEPGTVVEYLVQPLRRT